MAKYRRRSVGRNLWGLLLDALLIIWVGGMVARGCAALVSPVDKMLEAVTITTAGSR